MPDFTVRTVNSIFVSDAEVAQFATAEDALAWGVRGAVMIAADDIENGAKLAAIEVIVRDGGGVDVLRSAVSLAVAPLLPWSKSDSA